MTDLRTDPIGFPAVASDGTAGGPRVADKRRFRPEIQGLRALAVLLVVVYHVWLGRVSGGVDVFFLITGFLITGQLFRAAGRGGIRFGPMWGRMIRRLFPAALTVLLVTMAASTVLLPETRWLQTIREIIASALYFENWRLAVDSVDYFAQHQAASVVQHFWSLSIQGQFYLVWPLLVALVAVVAARTRTNLRATLGGTLAVVFAASLAYSVVLTVTNQPLAYFSSLTRVWEFALGGLLALFLDAVVLPGAVRVVLGWLGVLALVSCGLVLQVGTVFPGYLALWPTLAAVLVIVAGSTGSAAGADRFLSARPLRYLGKLSYSLYLWHWPVLVLHLVAQNRSEPSLLTGALVIAFSLALSALTYHLVETPLREPRPGPRPTWAAYRLGAIALVPVLVAALSWQWISTDRATAQTSAIGDVDHPGAAALQDGFEYRGSPDAELVPPLLTVNDDYGRINDCVTPDGSQVKLCSSPTAGTPERRIMVVGDSHAQQLIGAMVPMAETRNWQIVSAIHWGCPLTADAEESEATYGECSDWNEDLVREIDRTRPDAVVTLASRDAGAGKTERTPQGYVDQWRKLEQLGIPVVAIRDNPRFDTKPVDCVQASGPYSPECDVPRSEVYASEPPYTSMETPPNVSYMDLSDHYCRPDVCPAVVGNVVVYLDDDHITATYMRTVAPLIQQEFEDALGWR
ncbi:acyltransferase [Amycolatopsis antarctica]|uniref:Acyltransferase n=1 Tax=Amycolatopsis antarctica TaxID=1854586 RepID=A0A263D6H8_9PSEU|nr:acyltransferase family protein [Amycolatopsis antarctica]OZM73638.1 acyltransferase [Amycolatopsis antarctica]